MERIVEASASVNASMAAAQSLLRSAPESVLGDAESGGEPGRRTFRASVPAQLGAGSTVEQAVSVVMGPLRTAKSKGDGAGEATVTTATFEWGPTGGDRLLPSFSGELSLVPADGHGSRLTLRGAYQPPLGPVGRFGDSVIGHRVARHSVAMFVERLAERIDREALRRATPATATATPTPYNEDLRPHSASEYHLG